MELYDDIQIGDTVRIRADSQYFDQAPRLQGMTEDNYSINGYIFKVIFSNGYSNAYRLKDLELVIKRRKKYDYLIEILKQINI